MKKTKFKLPIFISILLLGLGCFLLDGKTAIATFSKIFYLAIQKKILQ